MPKQHWGFHDDKLGACPAFENGITTRRAIVPVRVGPEDNMSPVLEGMVDTGADYTFFPAEFLPALGINITELKTCSVNTILGYEDVPFAWVDVTVANFKSQKIYAGFSKKIDGNLAGIFRAWRVIRAVQNRI